MGNVSRGKYSFMVPQNLDLPLQVLISKWRKLLRTVDILVIKEIQYGVAVTI